MRNRILVIGATGLLGEPVANHLKRNGFTVRLLVRNTEKAIAQFGDDFEIVKGDLNDIKTIERAADGCLGVHMNLSGEIEQVGAERVSAVSAKLKLERITWFL